MTAYKKHDSPEARLRELDRYHRGTIEALCAALDAGEISAEDYGVEARAATFEYELAVDNLTEG
jgi:hypothetical protein